jgi:hypothetical protein
VQPGALTFLFTDIEASTRQGAVAAQQGRVLSVDDALTLALTTALAAGDESGAA